MKLRTAKLTVWLSPLILLFWTAASVSALVFLVLILPLMEGFLLVIPPVLATGILVILFHIWSGLLREIRSARRVLIRRAIYRERLGKWVEGID